MTSSYESDKNVVKKIIDGEQEDKKDSAQEIRERIMHPSPEGVHHALRHTDVSDEAKVRASKQVAIMLYLSVLSFVAFVVAFFAIPHDAKLTLPIFGTTSGSNLALGLTGGLGSLLIGIAAIHWAKKLMTDKEVVQQRHTIPSTKEVLEETEEAFNVGVEESAFKSQPILRRPLLLAMGLFPIPIILPMLDIGPRPKGELDTTLWRKGSHLVSDVSHRKLKPEDIPVGSLVTAIPEHLIEEEHESGNLNQRGKAAIVVVRISPDQIVSQQGSGWDYEGILAFSKICTHAGCPTSLYEQRSHHLLCPCHQTTFDLADSANVVFGPAARRMPQLPIDIDDSGYLIAQSDFAEPVGPSYWERG